VARLRRRVTISNHVLHVRWSNIAIENVRLLIVHNIRRLAKREQRSCMMRNYSKILHPGESVLLPSTSSAEYKA